jgi:hypothetical protein
MSFAPCYSNSFDVGDGDEFDDALDTLTQLRNSREFGFSAAPSPRNFLASSGHSGTARPAGPLTGGAMARPPPPSSSSPPPPPPPPSQYPETGGFPHGGQASNGQGTSVPSAAALEEMRARMPYMHQHYGGGLFLPDASAELRALRAECQTLRVSIQDRTLFRWRPSPPSSSCFQTLRKDHDLALSRQVEYARILTLTLTLTQVEYARILSINQGMMLANVELESKNRDLTRRLHGLDDPSAFNPPPALPAQPSPSTLARVGSGAGSTPPTRVDGAVTTKRPLEDMSEAGSTTKHRGS